MSQTFDVIIVGGGPAGAVAATLLGRAGIETLLLDKSHFPRDKACGDAVGGQSVELMDELGVEPELLNYRVARIAGEIFSSPSGAQIQIPFVPRPSSTGNGVPGTSIYVIRRTILDN